MLVSVGDSLVLIANNIAICSHLAKQYYVLFSSNGEYDYVLYIKNTSVTEGFELVLLNLCN